ncbi:flagellar M-ring protein FliF [Loktanella sp. 3ANDIMAR09]|uniref:flagellar basal-body MS-ring/collar protein FliF n=1 Tax=Loktanella sp. 3ANDIMAR09 TaxID=1225657 RepID=UPI00070139D1|nr:flagellar basal-body MS-ring/collar protein FliF [Loktanella sp. 3ANDIMAR09]KQI69952.1 flagellar M-ring protein FliF [Loktanella sp. 3ANDIMAR09]
MQGLASVWTSLGASRRLIAIGASVVIFLAVLLLARGASQRDLTLLFGGLEPAAAGEVITALDQRGAVYEVRGGAIYVPRTDRDMLRMSLAGEGLPQIGVQGYELLDGLSGFGTTSQMFDAAYWRAKEGELARTILANPAIRAARVHISSAGDRPFRRPEAPTAAVTVTTAAGGLGKQQIDALQYLVAAAVSGLQPGDVAIIDDRGGLLSGAEDLSAMTAGSDRAALLRARAERLLAARVGPGNAVVEVSVDTVTEAEQIVERTVDPESRIAISTDVTETASTAQGTAAGAVGVASNVPDGAAGGDGTSSNQNSETRALTNFEVSQVERQITRTPGAVRRLTVAVLVNDRRDLAEDGTETLIPRTPEELADLTALVSSAIGLDEARGDVITLRSMSFGTSPPSGSEAATPGLLAGPLSLMRIIQLAILAVVALILGLFVVRPILTNSATAALPAPGVADVSGPYGGEVIDNMTNMPIAAPTATQPVDPVSRLRAMIAERESETVQILHDWMDSNDKEAR